MSDTANTATTAPEGAETPAPAEGVGRRGVSTWFLIIPIALTLAAAAVAFFLLSPRDEELLTTTDNHAVAVAVANAQPAPAAFSAAKPGAQTPLPAAQPNAPATPSQP